MPAIRVYHCKRCLIERPDQPLKDWIRRGDLNRHVKTHDEEKPYQCTKCSRAFVQHSALKTHMNTHTGNKPHKCGMKGCDKRFGDPSSCSRHRKEAHSEISTYRCNVRGCTTKIKRKGTFVRHLVEHHGLNRPSERELRGMAVYRTKPEKDDFAELESPLARPRPFFMPRDMSSSLSPSSSPGPNGAYTMSSAAMSHEELSYDAYFTNPAQATMNVHGHYSLHATDDFPMRGIHGISMFGSMPMHDFPHDVAYDDGLFLSDSSSSSTPSASGMMSWDIEAALTDYSADRSGYTSVPPLYDC